MSIGHEVTRLRDVMLTTTADPVSHEPEPTYSKAALALFDECKSLPDDVKRELKTFAEDNGRKVSVAAFDADRSWADMVRAFIRHNTQENK